MSINWDVTVQETLMPFGKHKGTPLSKVPRDYLIWAVRNATIMKPGLRQEIEKHLGVPEGSTQDPPEAPNVSFTTKDGKQVAFRAKTAPAPADGPSRAASILEALASANGPIDYQAEAERLTKSLQGAVEDIRKLEADLASMRLHRNGQAREVERLTTVVSDLWIANAKLAAAAQPVRDDNPSDMEKFMRIVKVVFSTLSRQFHPDMGGDAKKQEVVNLFYRELVTRLRAQ